MPDQWGIKWDFSWFWSVNAKRTKQNNALCFQNVLVYSHTPTSQHCAQKKSFAKHLTWSRMLAPILRMNHSSGWLSARSHSPKTLASHWSHGSVRQSLSEAETSLSFGLPGALSWDVTLLWLTRSPQLRPHSPLAYQEPWSCTVHNPGYLADVAAVGSRPFSRQAQ